MAPDTSDSLSAASRTTPVFSVHVIDDREKFANRERFPDAAEIVVDDIPGWLDAHHARRPRRTRWSSRAGIATTSTRCARWRARPLRYLGLIGSRAKVKRIYDVLVEEGSVQVEQLEKVHAPIGLDIGAVTPQEIAVAIVAELIAVRRGKTQRGRRRIAALDAEASGTAKVASRCCRCRHGAVPLIRNATILTMNDALDVLEGDVLVRDGRIAAVGDVGDARADRVIDAAGNYLLPGFVQTHVHLCQTLFRGYADDLALLDWLKRRIWPMEAAHTPASLAAAARLAAAELLLGGTTTVLTMETVHDTDAVFEALEPIGLRAVVGKCMMDADDGGADAAARDDARVDRREPGARRALARPRPTDGCAPRSRRASRCPARGAARSGRRAVRRAASCSCTRMPPRTATRSRSCASRTGMANIGYLDRPRAGVAATVPRALRVGGRRRAAAARRRTTSRCCTAPDRI